MESQMGSSVNCKTYIGATNIISSLGFSTNENFSAAVDYQSGIKAVDNKFIFETPILAAQINKERLDQEVSKLNLNNFTTLEKLIILSINDVVNSSSIDISNDDCAIILSTTKGNVETLKNNTINLDERLFLNHMATKVANFFGAKNTPIVISNACISGVSATIIASRLIREKKYNHVIVTGGDLLSEFIVSGFTAFKSVSEKPCIPYDINRNGLTLGEGVATLLVTNNQSLSTGVVIEGGAITNDANHISGPSRTGDGLCYAMQQAMHETDITSTDISFINAHGTATSFNDEMESKAINMAQLQSIPVNSLKPYFGHTLGGAGIIELVMCVKQLQTSTLLATKGFMQLGVPEPIIVSGKHQSLQMKRCIKTASGFGGCNGAIVLALEQEAKCTKKQNIAKGNITTTVAIKDGKVVKNNSTIFELASPFHDFVRAAFKSLDATNMKFYKMDDLCKLGYLATEYLLKNQTYNPSEVAIILANQSSSLDTDCKHQNILNEKPESGVSPAVFVYTLPNVVLGEIAIRHKIQGENSFFIQSKFDSAFLESYAQMALSREGYKAVIYGWCELLGENYSADFKLLEK